MASLNSFTRGKTDLTSLKNTSSNTAKEARLRNDLKKSEKLITNAGSAAQLHSEYGQISAAGGVELEEDEHFKFISQKDILKDADILTKNKRFTLNLPGKYNVRYSPTGKYLMLASTNGHFSTLDWQTKNLVQEFDIREKVHDVCWLHQEQFFAAAQSKWTRIYENDTGSEIHCLSHFHKIKHLDFLPFHFLLVGAAERYKLHYLDVSTGKPVVSCNTDTNSRINCMKQSKANAIMHLAMQDGTVQLFSPNTQKGAVVKFLALREPCNSIALTKCGKYLAAAGVGKKINIFDLRNSYQPVFSHQMHPGNLNLTFSETGVLAACSNNNIVNTYKNMTVKHNPGLYLSFKAPENVQSLDFCPNEDVLGVGYARGFDSIILPGAGAAGIDSYESNPFRNKKQKDNWEVGRLLDKIPSNMICLDNKEMKRVKSKKTAKIDEDDNSDDNNANEHEGEGTVNEDIKSDKTKVPDSSSSESDQENENYIKVDPVKLKNKTKGRSKTGKKELRKKQIIYEKVRKHRQEVLEKKEKKVKDKSRKRSFGALDFERGSDDNTSKKVNAGSALGRFR